MALSAAKDTPTFLALSIAQWTTTAEQEKYFLCSFQLFLFNAPKIYDARRAKVGECDYTKPMHMFYYAIYNTQRHFVCLFLVILDGTTMFVQFA